MPRVCILLATYNGYKYLQEQIESLLAQSYKDLLIVIRDDGSVDDTRKIIIEYCDRYPQKVIRLEGTTNLGYPDCFWKLLEDAPEADYYAFSDQDDIWYPDKVSRAVIALNTEDDAKPKLYYHSYDICDSEGKIIDTYLPDNIKEVDIVKHFFYTYTMGFSMVINKAMRSLLLSIEPEGKELPHDVWCILNAYYFGNVYYDKTPQAAYRRHSSTVTSSGKGYFPLIKSWLKKEIFGDAMDKLRHRVALFFGKNKEVLGADAGNKYEFFYIKGGFKYYLERLFYPRRLKDTWGGEVALRILFLLNR